MISPMIYLGEEDSSSDYKHIDMDTLEIKSYRIEKKYPMIVNDALIFHGQGKVTERNLFS